MPHALHACPLFLFPLRQIRKTYSITDGASDAGPGSDFREWTGGHRA